MFRVLNNNVRVRELGVLRTAGLLHSRLHPLMRVRLRYGGTRNFTEEKGYEREESGR